MAGTPTSVSGVKTTSNFISARKVQDVENVIYMLESDKKSFMTFATKLGTRKVHRADFTWLTDEIPPKSGTTAASAASAAASATAILNLSGDATTVYLNIDDVIKFPSTGEVCRVSAVPANASATHLVRNLNGAATATIASGAQFVVIGDSREENSLLRNTTTLAAQTVGTVEASARNYTQTLREPVAVSRRAEGTKTFGPGGQKHEEAKALLRHCEKIENMLFHGVSATEGTRTYSRGIIDMVPSGNSEAITTLTEDEVDDFLRYTSRYGNQNNKVLAVSRFVHQKMSAWARSGQRITDPGGVTDWGVVLENYQSGSGIKVKLMPCNALEGVPGSSAVSGWDGYAVLIDMTDVRIAKFGDAYMKLARDLQEGDRDGTLSAIISDCGLAGGNLSHHGLITGVTG